MFVIDILLQFNTLTPWKCPNSLVAMIVI